MGSVKWYSEAAVLLQKAALPNLCAATFPSGEARSPKKSFRPKGVTLTPPSISIVRIDSLCMYGFSDSPSTHPKGDT